MKPKSTFLRVLMLMALLVPWTLQAQNAKVSEYDYEVTTATYGSIASTGTAWNAVADGYVDISMPFAMYFGETQITAGSTLRVNADGSATFTSLTGSELSPMKYSSGFSDLTANSIYYQASASAVTVEWRKVKAGSNSLSFQLKLYPNGNIEFRYGPMTIASSISVFSGMMSSATDIFRVGGSNWDEITRYTTGTTTRTLSNTYKPAYDATTGQGIVYTFTQPACVKPTAFAAASTADGANFSWTSNGTSFQIEYGTDPAFETAGTVINSTTATATVSGLTPFTTYYARVRTMCGTTPSAWSDVVSFMPAIYYTMGTNADISACTGMIVDDGGYTGNYSNSLNQTMIVRPGTAGKRIRIYGDYDLESNWDYVYIYDGVGTEGTLLATLNERNSYLDGITSNDATGALTIKITSDGSGTYGGIAFMVVCEDMPTCPSPFLPTALPDGTISWTASTNASSYEVAYGLAGFDINGSNITTVAASGTSTTLTGLASATTYDVYLRAVCASTNETSAWVGPVTFTTACMAMALPYSEDFSSYSGFASTSYPYYGPAVLPQCWDIVSSGTNTALTSGTSAYFGGVGVATGTSYGSMVAYDNYLCLPAYYYNSTSSTYVNYNNQRGSRRYAILPAFTTPLNDVMVSFNYKMSNSNAKLKLYLGYVTNDDTATFTVLNTYDATTTTQTVTEWALSTANVNIPTGARLAFKWQTTYSYSSAVYCGIDNILVEQVPTCRRPSALTVASVTSDAVSLSWTDASASQWEVKVGDPGFDPESDGRSVIVNSTSTTIGYLGFMTEYEAYVRAVCSATDKSDWSNMVTFKTKCPQGGDVEVTGTTTAQNYTLPVNTYYGYSYTQQIITAEEIGGAQTFNAISFNYAYTSPNNSESSVNIYIGTTNKNSFSTTTDYVDPSTLTLVYSGPLVCNEGWNEFTFTTPFVYNGTDNIVVACDENASSYSGSSYKFNTQSTSDYKALAYYSDTYNPDPNDLSSYSGSKTRYMYRSWMKLVSPCVVPCAAPEEVAVVPDVTSAVATWDATGADSYVVKYGPTGFNPATAGTSVNASSNTATLSNLEGYTFYDVYVASVCGSETSNYTMVTFRTRSNCNAPENVAVTNVTNASAVVSWDAEELGAGAYWTIKYGPAGFDPATEGTAVTTTTNTNELVGLDPNAKYDVRVMLVCSNVLSSVWTDPITFTTACPGEMTMIVGDATSTSSNQPTNFYYKYSLTEQIYTSAEIGGANTFTSIAFNYASDVADSRDVVIYLGETSKNSFTSTSDWISTSSMTQVYAGQLVATAHGWVNVTFSTPFEYTGSGNLVVAVDDNTGSYSSNRSWNTYTSDVSNQAMYVYSDGTNYDPTNCTTSGTRTSSKNQIRLGYCDASVTCFAPANFTSLVKVDTVALSWNLRHDLRPIVSDVEIKYGPEGFNQETEGYSIILTNGDTNFILTPNELAYGKTFDCYIRTVCDAANDDYSPWQKTTFTTLPSCWVPEVTSIDGVTANTITFSWTENTLPTAAQQWEIAYGPNGFDPDDARQASYVVANTNSNFVLSGLKHSTVYEIYVRSLCSANDYSEWSQSFLVATSCAPWTEDDLPIAENFSVVGSNQLPPCWQRINHGTSYNTYPRVNGTQLYFYSYYSSSYNLGDQYAVMPEVTANMANLDLTFEARYSSSADLEVGVMSDPTDTNTFTLVETIDLTSSMTEYTVPLESYTGNGHYVALRMTKPTSSTKSIYVDNLVLKVRENINTLADNGGNFTICNEYVVPTVDDNENYSGNVNATYILTANEPGKVLHLTGSYDLEYGYDFVEIFDGTTSLGRFTGEGNIDVKTATHDWNNHNSLRMVFTTDADNTFDHSGFKFLAACECPAPNSDTVFYNVDTVGSYVWVNGRTYNNVSNSIIASDRSWAAEFYQPNVAGCDSVVHSLNLVIHPSYQLVRNAEICQRDTFQNFYGQVLTTTGTYTGTALTIHGADSTTTLNLQMHGAPDAYVYYNGRNVTAPITGFCDGAPLVLTGQSNNANATFTWEDGTTGATHTVYPHENATYTMTVRETAYGCTSLPVNVNVTTTPVADPVIAVTDSVICFGDTVTLTVSDENAIEGVTFRWSNGATGNSITVVPTATTTYTVTATTTTNCATTASQTVTVNALPVVTIANSANEICLGSDLTLTATAVEGYNYSWNATSGTGLNTNVLSVAPSVTGNYFATVTVTDQNGCVSEFRNTAVAVHPSYEMEVSASDCEQNLPYLFGTQQLSTDGLYNETFTIAHGCDSIVHLTFTVLDTAVENSYRELCQGTAFTFGEGQYMQNYVAETTTDISYLDITGHCPVLNVLHLTVNNPAATSFERVVCDSTEWNGITYTESGNQVQTLATTKGCDSVVTMVLTVNYHSFAERTEVACDSLVWNNETYYTAGDYTQNFIGADQNGCDSTETVHLTAVNNATYTNDVICATNAYTWIDGDTYNMSEHGGNIIHRLAENTAEGCPQYMVLDLTVNLPADTTLWTNEYACDEYVIDTVACEGNIVTHYVRNSGDYMFRILENGNTVIKRVHLTIGTSTHHTNVVEACVPYTWQIQTGYDTINAMPLYTNIGPIWNDTIISFQMPDAGCGNIEVLRFTAIHPEVRYTDVTLCSNTGYSFVNEGGWNDDVINYNLQDGINKFALYVDPTDVDANQCRYNDTLRVNVLRSYNEVNNLFLCESQISYDSENDESYYAIEDAHDTVFKLKVNGKISDAIASTGYGFYWASSSFTVQTVDGCDSTVNYYWYVFPTVYETQQVAACYNYTWEENGRTYNESTIDTVIRENAYDWYGVASCDYGYILDLTVTDTIRNYDTTIVCTSYEYDGTTYRDSRTFREVVGQTAEGCDIVDYHTYEVRQRQLTDVYVVSTDPYLWHGETYTASTNNAFYNTTDINGCDSTLNLHFTKVDSVIVCEGLLPYTTDFGFVLDTDAVDGQYIAAVNNIDTIISYVILRETHDVLTQNAACDYYTWRHGSDTIGTYTADGTYTYSYTNEAGCPSVDTLKLTLLHNTNASEAQVACDSYTWHDVTYNASGVYTYAYNAATNGCPSVDTLHLTINVNTASKYNVTACYEYEWNNVVFTASDSVVMAVLDENGCSAMDTLVLTINGSTVSEETTIVNEPSYRYNGVLYTIPAGQQAADFMVIDTLDVPNQYGCDSILHMTLKLRQGNIYNDTVNYCGIYTWRNGHRYGWLSMAERQAHGMAFYMDLTDSSYVMTNPIYNTYNADGSVDMTYVLWLTLSETAITYETIADAVPLTWNSYTLDTTTGDNIDLSAFTAANVTADTTVVIEKRFGSTYYCDSVVYYTVNLRYNYNTADTAICGTETEFVWNEMTYPVSVYNHTYEFTQTVNAGTLNEQVTTMRVLYKSPITSTVSATACDVYTWNNQKYYTSGAYNQTLTANDGCDSVVTLNLTVNRSTSTATTVASCDQSYVWIVGGDTVGVYTANGTYMSDIDTTGTCPAQDTLYLTIYPDSSFSYTATACDSYTWERDGMTYTESDTLVSVFTDANGCPASEKVYLTVNKSVNTYEEISVVSGSYRLNGVLYTYPFDDTIDFSYTAVNGCDSTHHIHLVISQYQFVTENESACGMFTWSRNGHSYEYTNEPGALYRDITTGQMVTSMPLDTVGTTIYMLNLMLYEGLTSEATIARFPLSQHTLTIGDTTFDFSAYTADETVNRIVRFDAPASVCDSLVYYTINLVWNYDTVDDVVCGTETSYTWGDASFSGLIPDTTMLFTRVFNQGTADEQVTTKRVYIRPLNIVNIADTACDSYTWNDSVYTVSGNYSQTFAGTNGCDSVTNLALVIYNNSSNDLVADVCDTYTWIDNGTTVGTYTTSGVYTNAYTDVHGCASTDTLHLTVRYNSSHSATVVACDSYTWTATDSINGTGLTYAASNDAILGPAYTSASGCPSVDTLHLTVNYSTSNTIDMYESEGYRYTFQDGHSVMYTEPLNSIVDHFTNAAGCDSTLNINLHIGQAAYNVETVTACNSYTWHDSTYVWISAEERAAHNNALYLNQTSGNYVYYNPTYTYHRDGDYDSICLLMLTLTQNVATSDVVNFPVSLGTLTYGDQVFNFNSLNVVGHADTTVSAQVHFASNYYCDSVVSLTVNVINNYYSQGSDDICVSQSTYNWHNRDYDVATTNYDAYRQFNIYDTIVSGDSLTTRIEYLTLKQHPIVYATERRTACDTYTWNGQTFGETREPSYNATAILTNEYGCDSIVTLVLTMNYNTNQSNNLWYFDSVRWSYTGWTYADGFDTTITQSGVYTHEYTTADGCPSVDQLEVHIFPYAPVTETVTACDSYTWEGQTYTTDTIVWAYRNRQVTSDDGQLTAWGNIVDTLNLTVNHRTDSNYVVTACDSYNWFAGSYVMTNESGYTDFTYDELGNPVMHDAVAYTESGIYYREYTTAEGCPSVDWLTLTVNHNSGHSVDAGTVCDSYIYNNGFATDTFTTSGPHYFTYSDANECTSIDTVALNVLYKSVVEFDTVGCNSYTWDGTTYTASGEYTKTYTAANGCDSVVTMNLTIGTHPTYAVVETTSCGPYTWVVNGETVDVFTESVETSTEFMNPNTGCDSVVYLRLTVFNAPVIDSAVTVCESQMPYTWRGQTLTEAGTATVAFPIENNCDSTINMTLTVNPTLYTNLTAGVCLGLGYEGYDFSIPADSLTEAGTYTFVRNIASEQFGCDSIVTLTITVGDIITAAAVATACDSYTWNGMDYTTSGTYFTEPYQNEQGCLSVDTLHLTINVNAGHSTTAAACDSYEWNDVVYTTSGTYTFDYADNNGCASTDTLVLTINSSISDVDSVVACDSYAWNGNVYTTSGMYEHSYYTSENCNGIDTLFLTVNHSSSTNYVRNACDSYTWNDNVYTVSGVYTYDYISAEGCASTDTLTLTVRNNTNSSVTLSVCDSYMWNGDIYTTSGDYTYAYTAANGCASVDTLHLTVNYNTNSGTTATACDSYSWNGTTYTQSGTYYRHYNTANLCPSVDTLYLTINNSTSTTVSETACNSYTWNNQTYSTSGFYTQNFSSANGCDSTVTLMLTINRPVTTTVNATACGSYTWNGQTYTTSGNYTYTTTAANGCDSIVTLVLTINQPVNTTVTATACDSYTWNGASYTTSGNYTQTFTTVNGCDSVVTLALTISPAIQTSFNVNTCNSYTWNDVTYTTSGNYTHTYTSASGCDSVVTLYLNISPAVNMTFAVTACDSYTWDGVDYTATGSYTNTYTAQGGCDSIVTLMLTINNSTTGTETATACESYTWYGQTYTETGEYTHTLTAANGCDSVVTLSLTINNGTTGIDNQTACGSYTWIDGQTYTASTDTPTYTLTAANGCDSVVTLNLTVNYSYDIIDEVAACDGYIWIDNVNYTESTNTPTVTLTAANGCDSVITLNLTINHSIETYDTIDILQTELPYNYNGNNITAAGDYVFNGTTMYGCDSTVYLHVNVTAVGIDVATLNDIKIYPNPTRGRVTVTADNVVKIEVLDIVGRTVATFENTNTFDISNLGEGAYTLRISLPEGVTVRKVVKK